MLGLAFVIWQRYGFYLEACKDYNESAFSLFSIFNLGNPYILLIIQLFLGVISDLKDMYSIAPILISCVLLIYTVLISIIYNAFLLSLIQEQVRFILTNEDHLLRKITISNALISIF